MWLAEGFDKRFHFNILSKWIYCDAIVYVYLSYWNCWPCLQSWLDVQMTLIVKYYLWSPIFVACARVHVFVCCCFFLINRDAKARFAQHSIIIETVYWYVLLRCRVCVHLSHYTTNKYNFDTISFYCILNA